MYHAKQRQAKEKGCKRRAKAEAKNCSYYNVSSFYKFHRVLLIKYSEKEKIGLEHSIVQGLQRNRILSTSEREVNSGAKSTAQAEIKEKTHGKKWKIAERRSVGSLFIQMLRFREKSFVHS